MTDQVDEDIKEARYQKLMALQRKISRKKHKAFVGRIIPVVVEGYSDETELLLQGRSSQQAPEIDGLVYINEGTAKVGDIVNVEITDAHDYDLVGSIVHQV
jgi:ribosomal protein S12 methylthiotransferase